MRTLVYCTDESKWFGVTNRSKHIPGSSFGGICHADSLAVNLDVLGPPIRHSLLSKFAPR